jgi:transposase
MSEVTVYGIDLAKNSFSVCAMKRSGKVILRRTFSAAELVKFTLNLEPTLIAFEACGSAHHWGRLFRKQGHLVRMLPIHRVKAFTPPQKKNDAVDAEAICLAALHESIRSVKVKSVEQQDIEMLLNYREKLLADRIAFTNQVHALALEYGVRLKKCTSVSGLANIFDHLEDPENELTPIARDLISRSLKMADNLNNEIDLIQKKIKCLMTPNENFKRLTTIPGVGLLTAAAVIANTGGNVNDFKNGRNFAAYLGLTPRQYSTGGKTTLRGITKHGDKNIRRLLFQGAGSVLRVAPTKTDLVSRWALEKKKKRGHKYASVALAHKLARTVFAVLKYKENYEYRYAAA